MCYTAPLYKRQNASIIGYCASIRIRTHRMDAFNAYPEDCILYSYEDNKQISNHSINCLLIVFWFCCSHGHSSEAHLICGFVCDRRIFEAVCDADRHSWICCGWRYCGRWSLRLFQSWCVVIIFICWIPLPFSTCQPLVACTRSCYIHNKISILILL